MGLNSGITDWAGRVVWLVGASTGIGRATAALLHGQGARVVVSARNGAALAEFEADHAGSLGLALDATDRVAMQAAAARIVAERGRIDLACYCAGTYQAMRATAFDLDLALRHNSVNYVGALHLLDAVLPRLIAQQAASRKPSGSTSSRSASASRWSTPASSRRRSPRATTSKCRR